MPGRPRRDERLAAPPSECCTPSTAHRLRACRWNHRAKEKSGKQPAEMGGIVDSSTNEGGAQTEDDVHKNEPADLTKCSADAALNEWLMRPLGSERNAEEGEDRTRCTNRG